MWGAQYLLPGVTNDMLCHCMFVPPVWLGNVWSVDTNSYARSYLQLLTLSEVSPGHASYSGERSDTPV